MYLNFSCYIFFIFSIKKKIFDWISLKVLSPVNLKYLKSLYWYLRLLENGVLKNQMYRFFVFKNEITISILFFYIP